MSFNAKITEMVTITEGIYPHTGVGVSSSTLVDMSQFRRYVAVAQHGTATTQSAFNVRIYESTASTWGGAVAVLLTQTTVTVATAGTTVTSIEIDVDDITADKRYLGIYVTKVDTASSVSALHIRSNDRYLG